MNRAERLEQLASALLERLTDLPRDLFVPKYTNHAGTGLAPVAQEHFTVAYDGDTLAVPRLVLDKNPSPEVLRRHLVFRLDEKACQLHVCLALTALP